jgi:hypothetical protein
MCIQCLGHFKNLSFFCFIFWWHWDLNSRPHTWAITNLSHSISPRFILNSRKRISKVACVALKHL